MQHRTYNARGDVAREVEYENCSDECDCMDNGDATCNEQNHDHLQAVREKMGEHGTT